MAYGDVNYEWINSGSTGASADTAHLLFGNYQGLSDLHQSEVAHVMLQGITNDFNVGLDNTVTNNIGYKIGATSWFDLAPMRVGKASGLHIANTT